MPPRSQRPDNPANFGGECPPRCRLRSCESRAARTNTSISLSDALRPGRSIRRYRSRSSCPLRSLDEGVSFLFPDRTRGGGKGSSPLFHPRGGGCTGGCKQRCTYKIHETTTDSRSGLIPASSLPSCTTLPGAHGDSSTPGPGRTRPASELPPEQFRKVITRQRAWGRFP